MQSDGHNITPRTDAAIVAASYGTKQDMSWGMVDEFVHADFARQLEIELNDISTELRQARAEEGHLKEMLRQRDADYNRLKRDVAKAVWTKRGVERSKTAIMRDIRACGICEDTVHGITPAMAEGGAE